jgi:MGT family glycosyltransferase
MVLNPFEMEFPFHPHYTISYVGPMICSDREKLPFIPKTAETTHNIEKLLDSYRRRREGQCLIYCSFGCFFGGNDSSFWHKIAEALGNTDRDVIFALGNRLKPEALGSLPANIHCLEFAPQLEILQVADCAVIHAGMTTVYECILSETPMVVYPFKVNDQMGTAARVVYHHIGLRGNREKDGSAEIRNLVERVMNDPVLRENIGHMKKQIEKYSANNVVADAVERIIEASA